MKTFRLAIVGASPSGMMLALYLLKHYRNSNSDDDRRKLLRRRPKVEITIFEKEDNHDHQNRSDPDRSYTIDITGHGIAAVMAVDDGGNNNNNNLCQRFDKELIPFRGLHIHLNNKILPFRDNEDVGSGWTGSRGDICCALLHELLDARDLDEEEGSTSTANNSNSGGVTVDFKWLCQVTAVDVNDGVLSYCYKNTNNNTDTKTHQSETFDLIVGADGAGSMVRKSLEESAFIQTTKRSIPNYSRILHLDQNEPEQHLDPTLLHFLSILPWAVGGAILNVGASSSSRDEKEQHQVTQENTPKSFYVQVGYATDVPLQCREQVRKELAQIRIHTNNKTDTKNQKKGRNTRSLDYFVSEVEIEAFLQRQVYHVGKTVMVSSLVGGKAVLLGDAGTAFPPVGQGLNAAMESAVVLGSELVESLLHPPPPPHNNNNNNNTPSVDDDLDDDNSLDDLLLGATTNYNRRWLPEACACADIANNTVHYGSKPSILKFLLEGAVHVITGIVMAPAQLAKDRSLSYVEAWQMARRRRRRIAQAAAGAVLLLLVSAFLLFRQKMLRR